MIRTTDYGAVVWLELYSARNRSKIELPLELVIAFLKASKDEAELRRQLFNAGKISRMTEAERSEVDGKRPGLRTMTAKAGR